MRDVEGVKDAVVNIHTMELVVTPDGAKVDLDKVIRAIREAGFNAQRRKEDDAKTQKRDSQK